MDSVSWVRGLGVIIVNGSSFVFFSKPELSFEFDALYYENTIMKKVIDDVDFALTANEKEEIDIWIGDQLDLPLVVNGVDVAGNYHEGVPPHIVIKTVSIPPPSMTGWRYDFVASESGGDHWVQLH